MDKELLIQLFKSQSKIICYYLIKHGCTYEDAEDILQESLIKAIEYMNGVNSKNLPSWLFKVAINNYKNRVKKDKSINKISIDEAIFYGNFSNDLSVEDIIISKEKSNDILNVLQLLNEGQRDLLLLKYDMNLSYKEIAMLLGSTEGNIKTYLYRARNKFKEIWINEYK